MLINKIALFQMLGFASSSQNNGAKFQILLYIVTYLHRKSHDTIYRITQKTVRAFFRQILFIFEWNLQIVKLKIVNDLNKGSVKSGGMEV